MTIKFELHTTYPGEYINEYANSNKLALLEYGNKGMIGHHILILSLEEKKEVFFIYSAWNATYGAFYKCVLIH